MVITETLDCYGRANTLRRERALSSVPERREGERHLTSSGTESVSAGRREACTEVWRIMAYTLTHKSSWNLEEVSCRLLIGGVFYGQNNIEKCPWLVLGWCLVSYIEVTDCPKWVLSWFFHFPHKTLGFWVEQATTVFYISQVSLIIYIFAYYFWKCLSWPDDKYILAM
jgi:hypothetical protein